MAKLSGLQKDVLQLYKRSLKLVRSKPLEHRAHWFQFVATQFRSQSLGGGVKKRDMATIEYMIRRGKKMLDQYEHPSVRDVSFQQNQERWPEGWIARGGKARQRPGGS